MKSILVGAVETTRIALETLIEQGTPPVALFTLPLEKSARHSDYVHLAPIAEQHSIPVIPITNVNNAEVLDKLRFIQPDYSFVIGWSQICRTEFLEIARLGSIGYHPAPLPENRGRAVIPWTILQGRSHTGSTLFWMDEGADSGDILCQETFAIDTDETAETLYTKHCNSLRNMLTSSIPDLVAEKGQRQPQDHSQSTYCAKRTADDGLIDWTRPAEEIWQLIRAVGKPYPGAFTFSQGRKLVIWQADLVGAEPYWGLPGQIQKLDKESFLVQCGDRQHLLITAATVQTGQQSQPTEKSTETWKTLQPKIDLKQHEKLGINRLSLLPTV